MSMINYYTIYTDLLNKVKNCEISREKLNEFLMDSVDCEDMYNTNNILLSDIYFTLKHFAIGEESVTVEETEYFLECLEGRRKYCLEEKINLLRSSFTALEVD